MPDKTNGNDAFSEAKQRPRPDPHGQAALLLVKSLIFGLVERAVIRAEDALEIVDAAAEVKAEIAIDLGEPPENSRPHVCAPDCDQRQSPVGCLSGSIAGSVPCQGAR